MAVDAALTQALFSEVAVGPLRAERQHLLIAVDGSGFVLEAEHLHIPAQQQGAQIFRIAGQQALE